MHENAKTGTELSFKLKSSRNDSLSKTGILRIENKEESKINNNLEYYLLSKIQNGYFEACFQLGQLYFEEEDYKESISFFEQGIRTILDYQCMFQMGVIYFDGLGVESDPALGCNYMKRILESKGNPSTSHLIHAAAYCLGRAAYQGFGINKSDKEAERYWLIAADDGNPQASVAAQTALGYYYSSKNHLDFQKAFYWHSEACGNGSIESQACLGIMYLYGLGVTTDWSAAFICLKNAAKRDSITAKAHLSFYYFKRKLFTLAADLSSQVAAYDNENILEFSRHSSILIEDYLRKGISVGCFIFARCLELGLGVQKNYEVALNYYAKSFQFDSELCSDFQKLVQEEEL